MNASLAEGADVVFEAGDGGAGGAAAASSGNVGLEGETASKKGCE